MNAQAIFKNHKDEVVRLWTEAVFATYPLETTVFLRTKQDPFTNPVASMALEAASGLYDAVAGEDADVADIKSAIDRFIKLRAVQKFTPSQGIGVFFLLKPLLRERLLPKFVAEEGLEAYLEAESRLDSLALLAFDMYTDDRETLANIRIKEIRSQYSQLKRWARELDAGAPLSTDDA